MLTGLSQKSNNINRGRIYYYKYKILKLCISSTKENVLDYNRQLNKIEEASINKTAFETFGPNLRKNMGIKRFLSNLGLLGGGRSAKGPSVEVVNSSITYYLRPLKGLKRV